MVFVDIPMSQCYKHAMTELLGVTGPQCSGKDTVADILRDFHGFEAATSSDIVRDHIKDSGLGEPTRPLLANAARLLRAQDPAAIIRASLARCVTDRVVVSGLYSKAEAEYFVYEAQGTIIGCNANQPLRYQRALSRGRIGDDVSLDTFRSWEDNESASVDPRAQSISEVGKLAVVTIVNEGTYEELQEQVSGTLTRLGINRHV